MYMEIHAHSTLALSKAKQYVQTRQCFKETLKLFVNRTEIYLD